MKPFKLRGSGQKKKSDPKGGAALAPGAGAGAGKVAIGGGEALNVAALGTAAPGGGASAGLWSSLVSSISQATGLSAGLAGKAAVASLVVGATAGTVVVSMIVGSSTPTAPPQHGGLIFSQNEPAPEMTPQAFQRGAAPASSQGSGLEYLRQQQDDSIGEVPELAPAAAQADAPAPVKEIPVVPNQPAKAAQEKKHFGKPKMRAGKRLALKSSSLQSKVQLQAPKDLAGSRFQEIYKADNGAAAGFSANPRPRVGASRRTAPISSGGSATQQAKFANRMSNQGRRSGAASTASSYASTAFDGQNALGRTAGGIPGGGGVLGGTGLGSGASSIQDVKAIDTPPPPEDVKDEKNKTPYQGLIYAGMGALMIGMMLLKMAGKLIQQGRAAGPAGAAQIAQGKAMAMAAMAAGGAAAGIGGMLMGEYDQLAQGLPFMIGGGALAVQAGMVLAKADQAGEQAQGESDQGFAQAGQQIGQMLGQAAGQQGNQVDSDLDKNTDKQRQRVDVNKNSGGADAARGGSG